MTDPQQPVYDPAKGKAYFTELGPRYAAIPRESLAPVNIDAGLAAIAALGIAARTNEPALRARFQSLPASEFDSTQLDLLPKTAWACWYAATEDAKARAVATDAKLPIEMVQRAAEIERRMQACCEYYFNDHLELGPYLAALRSGTGHRDLASDLLGYASIYADQYDTIKDDKKHYRPTDADDAVKLAEEMLTLLGSRLTPEARTAADNLARAWTLLRDTFNDVVDTGRWLLRKDPRAAAELPSLFYLARPRSGGRPAKPAEPAPGTPA